MSQDPGDSAFHFFDMPREIRNMIYVKFTRHARFDQDSPQSNPLAWPFSTANMSISGFPCTNMQLVSRTFKSEYEKEIALHFHQTLSVRIRRFSSATVPAFDAIICAGLAKVTHLDLYLNHMITTSAPTSNGRLEARHMMEILLPYLRRLERVIVRPNCGMVQLSREIISQNWTQEFSEPSVRRWLLTVTNQPDVELQVRFALRPKLYKIWKKANNAPLTYLERRAWNHNELNGIDFEATLSSGPYSWNGLDFTLAPWDSGQSFEGVAACFALQRLGIKSYAQNFQKLPWALTHSRDGDVSVHVFEMSWPGLTRYSGWDQYHM